MITQNCPYEFCDFKETKDCIDNTFGCLKSTLSRGMGNTNIGVSRKSYKE